MPQSSRCSDPETAPVEPADGRRDASRFSPSLVVGLAACGSTTPPPAASSASSTAPSAGPSQPTSPSPPAASAAPSPLSSQQLASLYSTIENQVITIRQLHPKTTVAPTLLDDAGIKKLTTDEFNRDNPPALVDANQRMYEALGMLPAGASLHDLYVELLGSQVAGLYSPTDKHLYVVARSGQVGPAERVTFSHEFTHALQDQNFDLGSLKLDEIGQGDRSLARLSLVEGDATLVMTLWQQQNLSAADNAQILAQSASDPATGQLLAMPAILRESLFFPYFQGASFVEGLFADGGWAAVDNAFSNPPASSEQILHPAKYAARELPIATALPADLAARLGTSWKSSLEDTFGEFQLGVWLRAEHRARSRSSQRCRGGMGRRPHRGARGTRRCVGRRPSNRVGHTRRRHRVRDGGPADRRRTRGIRGVAARRRRQRALGRRRLGRRDAGAVVQRPRARRLGRAVAPGRRSRR